TIRGAAGDLPSGSFGLVAPNAARDLAAVVAGLHQPDGRVAVPGFYNEVREPTPADQELYAQVPFDENEFLAQWQLPGLFGEPGYSPVERRFMRPSVDVNGIGAGYQGSGRKTVVPSAGTAKLTFRLVPDQDPDTIIQRVTDHIRALTPPWATVTVSGTQGSAPPANMCDPAHPAVQAAAEVLGRVYDRPAIYVRSGGTLPFASFAVERLGVPLIQYAFGTADANVHAPDEYLPLVSFQRGIRSFYLYLQEVGDALKR
ncbi:MAG: M20/M25/M40 family metallo-hydrolase, partial [Thermaerobacterales bacterium]